MNKRTWLWIIAGVLVVLMVGCLTLVGTGVYVVSRQMQVSSRDEGSADRDFEDVRDQFRGQSPLIVIGADGRPSLEAFERRAAEYSGPAPSSVHVMAYDPREKKLVRLSLPFWLLRLGSSGHSQFRIDQFDLDRLQLSAADLERAGPALLLDHTERGARVMLWSE